MKKIIALLLLFIAAACFGNNQHDHEKQAQKSHATISVPTIQCQLCVERIQTAVKKFDGVGSVNIDLKEKIVHVTFDPTKTSQEKIEKTIAAAGYDANNTKRNEKTHAKLPKCCQSVRK